MSAHACKRRRVRSTARVAVRNAKYGAKPLDGSMAGRYIAPVAVNPATGFDSPNAQADSRHRAVFLRPLHTIGASISMAGRGGDTFGYAGSLCAGLSTLPRACHPRLTADGRPQSAQGATMPKFITRAISALFPVSAIPVSTLPTLTEARALAALLVAQGRRVSIAPAAHGFTVSEVAA